MGQKLNAIHITELIRKTTDNIIKQNRYDKSN
jgi:hypothetical protein